jgi:hypothetical protein
LHSVAQDQLDQALSNAVNLIPPGPPAPVAGTIAVQESMINNLLPLVHAPSGPVQNMHMLITPSEMRFDFTVYGFASDITGVPTVNGGNLVVTQVKVEGIAGLIMSSDEMTTLLNRHLSDVQAKLGRPPTMVQLFDHRMDITLAGLPLPH